MGRREETKGVAASYDRVSGVYVDRLFDELAHKPLDRKFLDRFVEETRGTGRVCDLGCGPGHVARHLRGRGAEVFGIDLSAGMVEQARRSNPEIDFEQGDMLSLDAGDESWGGIVAFYSVIHIPREDVPRALDEFQRVLVPGGVVLVSFHVGRETRHVEEMWGESVSLDFEFFETTEMKGWFEEAGFEVVDVIEREPYDEDVEVQTRRAYIFARNPAR